MEGTAPSEEDRPPLPVLTDDDLYERYWAGGTQEYSEGQNAPAIVDGAAPTPALPQSAAEQWEAAAGETCARCRQPALRLVDGKCPKCRERQAREEARTMEKIHMARTYSVQSRRRRRSL